MQNAWQFNTTALTYLVFYRQSSVLPEGETHRERTAPGGYRVPSICPPQQGHKGKMGFPEFGVSSLLVFGRITALSRVER
jgi:hypothetical protein